MRKEPDQPLSCSITPKRRTDVTARLIEGEAVILDRRRELIHQLNPTATFVWEQCDGESSIDEVADRLAEAFDVDLPTALKDTHELMQQLLELGIVERPTLKPIVDK